MPAKKSRNLTRRSTALFLASCVAGLVVLTCAGCGAQEGSPPQSAAPPASADRAVRDFIAKGQPIYCGGAQAPYVALTFDDGPGALTSRTLDQLRAANQRATFFLIGREISRRKDLPSQEASFGAVGNHTWTHPLLTRLPKDQVFDQLSRTQQAIAAATGTPAHLFRPPYGAYNKDITAESTGLGMLQVLWNVDSRDSEGARADQIVRNVDAGLRPGSIILFHENKPETQRALPRVLDALRQRNLRSVSVPELLALDPPSDSQLQGGPRNCPVPLNHPPGEKLSPSA